MSDQVPDISPEVKKPQETGTVYPRDYRWWDDEKKLLKFEQAIAIGATIEMACYNAGISYTQYYYYSTEVNPDYKTKIELLEQHMPLRAANEVNKGIANNPEFALKVLERVSKKKFAPRTEVTGEEGKPLNEYPTDLKSLDERISSLMEKLKGLNGQSSGEGSNSL